MHFSVLVFINEEYQTLEDVMERYHFETPNPVEAEFNVQLRREIVKEEYNKDMSDTKVWRENLAEYLKCIKMTPQQYFNHTNGWIENEDGDLGWENNVDGRIDYYSIGGRWKETLITKDGEFTNDALISDIDWKTTEEAMKKHYDNTANISEKFNGLTYWIWNILDEDDEWIDNPDDKEIKEYIEKHKGNENIRVYILDCHS